MLSSVKMIGCDIAVNREYRDGGSKCLVKIEGD